MLVYDIHIKNSDTGKIVSHCAIEPPCIYQSHDSTFMEINCLIASIGTKHLTIEIHDYNEVTIIPNQF